jgi:hypothetical protein
VKNSYGWFAAAILVLATAIRVYFAVAAPFEPYQVTGKLSVYNDEPAHRSVIEYWVLEGGHPSRGVDPTKPLPIEHGNIVARTGEDYQPPLYYFLAMFTLGVSNAFPMVEPWLFPRLLSVAFGIISLIFVWLGCRLVLSSGESLAALAFGAVLLSHVRFTSLVTNDSLLWAISAAVIYLMIRRIQGKGHYRMMLILLTAAGLWTKLSFLPVVFVLPAAWILGVRYKGSEKFPWDELVFPLLLWAPWLYWSYVHWGQVFPLAVGFGAPATFIGGLERVIATMIYTFRSFWFPFDDIWGGGMKPVIFIILGVVGFVIFILSLLEIIRQFELRKLFPISSPEYRTVMICLLTLGLVSASFIWLNLRYFQSEARLLFPAFLPIVVLTMLGFRRLLPSAFGPWLLPILAVFSYQLFY